MKKMLMRPTAALFPAVLLLAALRGDAHAVAGLFTAYIAIQLLSLCSVEAFRNAAAREPGVRRVDRRFSGTWPMILFGIAATCAVGWFLQGKTEFLNQGMCLVIAAGGIVIEQLFEERMFALSRNADGVVLSVLSSVLLLAGLLMDASGGVAAPVNMAGFYTACGAGLGAVISIAANYAMEPMRAFSLIPRNIAFFPRAAVQSLLYPAVMIGMYGLAWLESGSMADGQDLSALLAGMVLWRISRTVCRRASDESRPLNLLVTAVCAAVMVASLWVEPLQVCADGVFVAMICAIAVFCARGWRIYGGAALIAGAWLISVTSDAYPWAVVVCSVIAVILNLHKAFLRKV